MDRSLGWAVLACQQLWSVGSLPIIKSLLRLHQAAKIRGAKTIIAVDRVASRLTLARELGATHVINTTNLPSLTVDLIKAIKNIVPHGTNANFDTTGVVPIIDAGVQSLQLKGQMVLIGIVDGQMNIDLGSILTVSNPS